MKNPGISTLGAALVVGIIQTQAFAQTSSPLRAWGYNLKLQTMPTVGVVGIAAGGDGTLVLDALGHISASGRDVSGSLVAPSAVASWTRVATSTGYSGGVDGSGAAWVWGSGTSARWLADSVLDIRVGAGHALALMSNRSVTCVRLSSYWSGSYGQESLPTGRQFTDYIAISTSFQHNAALRSGGEVTCWGRGFERQCQVPPQLPTCRAVAAGSFHTAAVTNTGSVICWGYDGSGQCSPPQGLDRCIGIAAGERHTIALRDDGTVVCFGANQAGQCTPPLLGSVVEVACGTDHSAVRCSDGSIVSWGSNRFGVRPLPIELATAVGLSGGWSHILGIGSSGIVAWGANEFGQCDVPSFLAGVSMTMLGAGGAHSIALSAGGEVFAWGSDCDGQATVPSSLPLCTKVAAGDRHSLAVDRSGVVHAWGWNAFGQCNAPMNSVGSIQVVAGQRLSAALLVDGTVVQWGAIQATDSVGAIRIASGRAFTIGLRADGSVWGGPADLPPARSITAAYDTAAALLIDGTVRVFRGVSLAPDDVSDIATVCSAGTFVMASVVSCTADLNRDWMVDGSDLGLLLSNWGQCETECLYDLNSDRKVNGGDLGLLLSSWGSCIPSI